MDLEKWRNLIYAYLYFVFFMGICLTVYLYSVQVHRTIEVIALTFIYVVAVLSTYFQKRKHSPYLDFFIFGLLFSALLIHLIPMIILSPRSSIAEIYRQSILVQHSVLQLYVAQEASFGSIITPVLKILALVFEPVHLCVSLVLLYLLRGRPVNREGLRNKKQNQ